MNLPLASLHEPPSSTDVAQNWILSAPGKMLARRANSFLLFVYLRPSAFICGLTACGWMREEERKPQMDTDERRLGGTQNLTSGVNSLTVQHFGCGASRVAQYRGLAVRKGWAS